MPELAEHPSPPQHFEQGENSELNVPWNWKNESDEQPRSDVVEFGGVTLEKGTGEEYFVPRKSEHYIDDAFSRELQQKLAVSFHLHQPILIEGGTSLGKSTTVRQMAAELGWSVHSINMTGTADVESMMGRYTPNPDRRSSDDPEYKFSDGPVTSAIREAAIGHKVVLLIDEINAASPNILIRLHELIDAYEKNSTITLTEDASEQLEVIKENLYIVAVANPPSRGSSQFAGREPLDPAQLRRWSYHKLPDNLPAESQQFYIEALFGLQNDSTSTTQIEQIQTPDRALSKDELSSLPGLQNMIALYREFHNDAKEMVEKKNIANDQPQPIRFDDREEPRRVMEYVQHFYNGDLNEVFQRALTYYYVNKLASDQDRQKLKDLITHVHYIPPSNSRRIGIEHIQETETREQAITDEELFERLEKCIQNGAKTATVLKCLAGNKCQQAELLRRLLAEEPGTQNSLGRSYAGILSEESQEWREKMLREQRFSPVASSMVGNYDAGLSTYTPQYMAEFMGNLKRPTDYDRKQFFNSLAGSKTSDSYSFREGMEGVDPKAYLTSIIGLADNYSMAQRKKILENTSLPEERSLWVAQSLVGIDNEAANKMREQFAGYPELLGSFAGVESVSANAWRKFVLKAAKSNGKVRKALIASLSGVYSPEADRIRAELNLDADEMAESLNGNWILAGVKAAGLLEK